MERNEISVKLSKEIYEKEAIAGAADILRGFCSIKISEEAGYFTINLLPTKTQDSERMAAEFINWCLHLTKENKQK
jgi:hypothetical protein